MWPKRTPSSKFSLRLRLIIIWHPLLNRIEPVLHILLNRIKPVLHILLNRIKLVLSSYHFPAIIVISNFKIDLWINKRFQVIFLPWNIVAWNCCTVHTKINAWSLFFNLQINLILISIYIPIENRTQSEFKESFNNERKKNEKNLWIGLVFSKGGGHKTYYSPENLNSG